MEVLIFIVWFFFSLLVGAAGSDKNIGFVIAFIISLFLSPIIGLLFVIASPEKKKKKKVKLNSNLAKASRYLDVFDIEKAIEHFNYSLENGPDPNTYFKLAQCYSLIKDKEQTLYYIDRAIESGFTNLEKINTNHNLMWLREQPEYAALKQNGFKKETKRDNISILKDLAELREKNLLTEDEFIAEKAKILG